MRKGFWKVIFFAILFSLLMSYLAYANDNYYSFIGKSVKVETRYFTTYVGRLIDISNIQMCDEMSPISGCMHYTNLVTLIVQLDARHSAFIPEKAILTIEEIRL